MTPRLSPCSRSRVPRPRSEMTSSNAGRLDDWPHRQMSKTTDTPRAILVSEYPVGDPGDPPAGVDLRPNLIETDAHWSVSRIREISPAKYQPWLLFREGANGETLIDWLQHCDVGNAGPHRDAVHHRSSIDTPRRDSQCQRSPVIVPATTTTPYALAGRAVACAVPTRRRATNQRKLEPEVPIRPRDSTTDASRVSQKSMVSVPEDCDKSETK